MADHDDITRLAEKWRGENGDYPESKLDCADELEAVLAQQGKAGGAHHATPEMIAAGAKFAHDNELPAGKFYAGLYAAMREAAPQPPAHSPDAGATDGRQEFEKWAQKRHGLSVQRWDDSGEYTSHLTRNWWQCWTESRSTLSPAPQPKDAT